MSRIGPLVCILAVMAAVPALGKETGPRSVDGVAVPPFGYLLDGDSHTAFLPSDEFLFPRLAAWPDRSEGPSAGTPLYWWQWTGGPYKNSSGQKWFARINEWYRAGTAAGLSQDTFRSFDNGHSRLVVSAYPQLHTVSDVPSFVPLWEKVFLPRVTMGVQSYGSKEWRKCVIEANSCITIQSFYESHPIKHPFQRPYRTFYENNFLFVAPAVSSFTPDKDGFSFLSPFYLHSIGHSGSDSKVLKPFVLASAALPPKLKTRILRKGLFVPTLMYLFKANIAGDIKLPAAHVPAYDLPAESEDGFDGPTPFLDAMLNSAHNLTHIPPVCRLKIERLAIEAEDGHGYGREAYREDSTYGFIGTLREGQAFVMKVDLRYSWTDNDLPIASYYASVLRGKGTITYLNEKKSLMTIRIPWSPTDKDRDFRTDVLLLVNDGTYSSAPAYISIRNINKLDPLVLSIKTKGSASTAAPSK